MPTGPVNTGPIRLIEPYPARPLDCTRFRQLGFPSLRPGHRRLFAGERLALLVDCHLIAVDADLSCVADGAVGLLGVLKVEALNRRRPAMIWPGVGAVPGQGGVGV